MFGFRAIAAPDRPSNRKRDTQTLSHLRQSLGRYAGGQAGGIVPGHFALSVVPEVGGWLCR